MFCHITIFLVAFHSPLLQFCITWSKRTSLLLYSAGSNHLFGPRHTRLHIPMWRSRHIQWVHLWSTRILKLWWCWGRSFVLHSKGLGFTFHLDPNATIFFFSPRLVSTAKATFQCKNIIGHVMGKPGVRKVNIGSKTADGAKKQQKKNWVNLHVVYRLVAYGMRVQYAN